MNEQKITSLLTLKRWVDNWIHNCELNYKDPADVEFIIVDSTSNHKYRPFDGFLSIGKGTKVGIDFFQSDIIRFDPKDERPEIGEYWRSRGPSTFDCSGFISSKAAGLRILRMIKYILDTDEPKSWLDYREHEPNWIQFKFSAEEFDVNKLDELSRAAQGIITDFMLKQCKL